MHKELKPIPYNESGKEENPLKDAEMNSKTNCVKAQVNKLSIHITMLQRRQEKDHKNPFGKADHYLRRLLKTICLFCCRKREKVMRNNCKFSLFLQTLGYLLQMAGLSTFLAYFSLPELLFLRASTDCTISQHVWHTQVVCESSCLPQEVGRAGHKSKADVPFSRLKFVSLS